jgi:hypothetical protein
MQDSPAPSQSVICIPPPGAYQEYGDDEDEDEGLTYP